MLKRDGYGRHRPIIVVCDGCDDEYQTLTPDLDKAVERAKRVGWIVDRMKKTFIHLCRKCSGKRR